MNYKHLIYLLFAFLVSTSAMGEAVYYDSGSNIEEAVDRTSKKNSTTAVLGAGDSWNGQWEEMPDYPQIYVLYNTNVASAADGVEIHLSTNKIHIDKIVKFSSTASSDYPEGHGGAHTVDVPTKYYRVKYTNGAGPQTKFRLQTSYVNATSSDLASDTLSVSLGGDTVSVVVTGPDPLPTQVMFPDGNIDAFGQFRVSNPVTLFDSKQLYHADTLFWDDAEVSGAGTSSVYNQDGAETTIAVSGVTAGRRVRQTYQRWNYQPGKSQKVLMTGVIDATGGDAGITRRIGNYDDDNGIGFMMRNDSMFVFVRSSVTGSPVDTEIYEADWNVDPMDGTGDSGINILWDRTQIFFFDYEWLGVGTCRFGLVYNGQLYYIHKQHHANISTTVYMSTPNLPLRYEVENDGTGAASSVDHVCSTVISEGGKQNTGLVHYASTAGTHVDAATENTDYAIIGIRLKSGYIGQAVRILESNILLTTGSEQCEWILYWNPTVAGSFTYGDVDNTAVQIATGATANTITGGIQIAGGYVTSGSGQTGNAGSISGEIFNSLQLGSAIDGTLDEIVLALRPIAGSVDVDVEGSIQWIEPR